ncbi:hypothetical protein [Rhodococcus sp. NPDC006774]|uniref:hypothetical protein n=1 Tax=Rhodococcus sp. NPDC006774 TaxID=3157186 RepID=UPI0033E8EFCA
MIEVVALDGQVTTYDGEGSEYRLVDGGHLSITEEYGDSAFTHSIAVHAAGTWAIARKVTA